MALTETQITDLSKMIGEGYVATQSALPVVTAVLDADAVAAIEADLGVLITRFNSIPTSSFRMEGGRDGIYLSFAEERKTLMVQARTLLGLSEYPSNYSEPDSIQYVRIQGGGWF